MVTSPGPLCISNPNRTLYECTKCQCRTYQIGRRHSYRRSLWGWQTTRLCGLYRTPTTGLWRSFTLPGCRGPWHSYSHNLLFVSDSKSIGLRLDSLRRLVVYTFWHSSSDNQFKENNPYDSRRLCHYLDSMLKNTQITFNTFYLK